MEFTFTADTSPISDGQVWFDIPREWDPPVETDKEDVAGRVTATFPDDTYSPADLDDLPDPVHADDLTVSSSSGRITIKVKELAIDGTITILYGANDDKRPAVQDTAQDDLEITGHYMVGSNRSHFPPHASNTVDIIITNAADGSGSATIDVRGTSSHEVRAGSEDNRDYRCIHGSWNDGRR